MEFFPLTLGIPKPRPPIEPGRENRSVSRTALWDELAWRKSASAPPDPVEEVPAADVLERLRAQGGPRRIWLILGEPGADKSRLLEHWHATWLRALTVLRLGLPVPVLIRLRELDTKAVLNDPATIADRLWRMGAQARIDMVHGLPAAALESTRACLRRSGC